MLEGEPPCSIGWRCLLCDTVVDLHGLTHCHKQLERDESRRLRLRERVVSHG